MRPVNERPQWPTGIRPTPSSIAAWGEALIRQLVTVFQEFGYRLNHVLPKDGTEAMEGDLDMGGNGFTNVDGAVQSGLNADMVDGQHGPFVSRNGDTMTGDLTVEPGTTSIITSSATGDPAFPVFRGKRSRGSVAAPAAVQNGDSLLYLQTQAHDGAAFVFNNGIIACVASENWTQAARGTRWNFSTTSNGAATATIKMLLKDGLYMTDAAGGDKGPGTINATAVYDDNVLLTCYVLEAELSGQVDPSRWDDRVLDRQREDGKTETLFHEPARRFAARAAELLDPAQYAAQWRKSGHLPSMPSPAEWDAADKKMAVGDIVQRLWETVEVQAVHIDKLRQRLDALEATRRTL